MSSDSTPLCPVCRSIFVRPRMYACGHSVCSHCMQTSDEYTSSPFMHSFPVYKCPVCRAQTLVPWHRRPPNVNLRQVCERHPDYVSRLVEVGPETKPSTLTRCGSREDLSKLAFSQQQAIAHEIYDSLLPLLHEAALEGRSIVSLNDETTVRKIQRVGDSLGQLLFHRHNMCKMVVTSADVTFYFLKTTLSMRAERMNRRWADPLSVAIDSLQQEEQKVEEDVETGRSSGSASGGASTDSRRRRRTSYEDSYGTPWHTRNQRAVRATSGLGDPFDDLVPPQLG